MENNKKIIIFFGPPGSGKGTQAERLSAKIGLPVISPGNLFRHEHAEKTKIGEMITKYMAKGELVPDNLVEEIIEKRLQASDTKKGFMLDGYPRRNSQLKVLRKRFKEILSREDKVIAIYIDTSDQKVIERISGRRICECGVSFHIKSNPPKKDGICDICGGHIHQRKDDAPDIIKKRLKNFHKRIKPLIKYFTSNNLLITVDGNNAIQTVEKDILTKLKGEYTN